MAVSKLWPVKVRLSASIKYVTNPEKTSLTDTLKYAANFEKTDGKQLVTGVNCGADTAAEDFIRVKNFFRKDGGVIAYHGYLSFKPGEVTGEQGHLIGVEFAERVWGKRFQVLVATHLNTDAVHCHFVINSVSYIDGKKLVNEEKAWFINRKIADEICMIHGLSVIDKPERNRDPDYLRMLNKQGGPTRYNLAKAAIDEAIAKSSNMAEFKLRLKSLEYNFDFNSRHKYWTITPKGSKKPIRMYRLGEDYTNDRILQRLAETKMSEPWIPEHSRKRNPQLKRRRKKVMRGKKIGGIKGLYLHYCYRLGIIPKRNPNPKRVHYLLRDDLARLEKTSEEMRLLGKNHINTDEQLEAYMAELKDKIEALTEDRRILRKELKICERILEQAPVKREKLAAVENEKKKERSRTR